MVKTKDVDILRFQGRVLDLTALDEIPLLEKVNFINIVTSNVIGFLSTRLESHNRDDRKFLVKSATALLRRGGFLLDWLCAKYHVDIPEGDNYLMIQKKELDYTYSEENDLQSYIEYSEVNSDKSCYLLLYGDEAPEDITYEEFIAHIPVSILRIKQIVKSFKEKYPNEIFRKVIPKRSLIHYSKELLKNDLLIRTPYESYEHILGFIWEMCNSEDIHTVVTCLYRSADNSRIVEYLKDAAKHGKNVLVYIEPLARGDETKNLDIVEDLKSAGAKVFSRYMGYKVHAKVFLAIGTEHSYTHIGTGNYNENTALQYTDCHLLTSDSIVAAEVSRILMNLFHESFAITINNEVVFSAPLSLREVIVTMIRKQAKLGEQGRICIKCNNLDDRIITNELLLAGKAGCSIKIIVRTRSGNLHPIGDNMIIRSKVGQFLEHERIYIFGERVFIGSADLLPRNLDGRVELISEVQSDTAKKKLEYIFNDVWNNNTIHEMDSSMQWKLLKW